MNREQLKVASASHPNGFNVIDALKKTNYSIIDLLPQNNLAVVHDSQMVSEIVKMLYHVTSLLAECLHKFYISKQYQYFDPHVGESACQIRAYVFVILARKGCDYNVLMERLDFLNSNRDKLKKILDAKINYKNNSYTIVELTKKYELYFFIEWQECFLCRSYFLTLFKKTNEKGVYICRNEIAHFLTASKRLSERMTDTYQSHLAMMSCDFIKIIALELNINAAIYPSVNSSIVSDNAGRMVYPCFFLSRILLMHIKKTTCTVLMILDTIENNHSRKDLILFDGGAAQGRLLIGNNNPIKEDVCVVVIGIRIATVPLSPSELLKKLNYFGLYDILLMNMAAHPQFSGSKLIPFANQLVPDIAKLTSAEKVIEAEFLTLKSNAHKYGFYQDNPSMLLIKHIFMDTIKNQINVHQNTNYISVRDPIDI